jgi:hypothetical protein
MTSVSRVRGDQVVEMREYMDTELLRAVLERNSLRPHSHPVA